jgi:glycosyltransferase involved in cell wall biosynthesis
MPDLIYISLMRFPNEKAHSLQIVQNCEAFAQAGRDVALWVTARYNTPDMRAITDVYAHYGVQNCFGITRLPVLDLLPLCAGNLALERVAFALVQLTFVAVAFLRLLFHPPVTVYTRDEAVAWAIGALRKHTLVYEAHLYKRGAWLQTQACRRARAVIAITPPLAHDLIATRGADAHKVLTAHDGIRAARFAHLPTQQEARARLGWSQEAFIVGFVGRLHMLNVEKGVSTLIHALARLEGACIAIVGGPDDIAESYRTLWRTLGQDDARFIYVGQVPPDDVPAHICAFSVCAMPHPHTAQYAKYTSPLKLFEYMACGKPIVASSMAGWADVLEDGANALLVPPDDAHALAHALARLRDDSALAEAIGARAHADAHAHYTWARRTERILAHMDGIA